jgi:hypothetical protein
VQNRAPLAGGLASYVGIAALLLILLGALTYANVKDPTNQVGPEITEESFTKRLRKIAGPDGMNCGYVAWEQRSAALKCVENALANRRPFYYAFRAPYIRESVGLVMDPSGHTWQVRYWYDIWEGSRTPRQSAIRVWPCPSPRRGNDIYGCPR